MGIQCATGPRGNAGAHSGPSQGPILPHCAVPRSDGASWFLSKEDARWQNHFMAAPALTAHGCAAQRMRAGTDQPPRQVSSRPPTSWIQLLVRRASAAPSSARGRSLAPACAQQWRYRSLGMCVHCITSANGLAGRRCGPSRPAASVRVRSVWLALPWGTLSRSISWGFPHAFRL